MNLFLEHLSFVNEGHNIASSKIRKGNIVSFVYEGRRRYTFVLNPSWKNSANHRVMHAVALEHISREVLLQLLALSVKASPQQLYHTYLKQQPQFIKYDAYRTFLHSKMQSHRLIQYDTGYNKFNPNALIECHKSFILGYKKLYGVYAEEIPTLIERVRAKAKEYGVYYPDASILQSPDTVRFLKFLQEARFAKSWNLFKVEDSYTRSLSENERQQRQATYLKNMLYMGGVFIMSDEDIQLYKTLGAIT